MLAFKGIYIPRLVIRYGDYPGDISKYGPGAFLPDGPRIAKIQWTRDLAIVLCVDGTVWRIHTKTDRVCEYKTPFPCVDIATNDHGIAIQCYNGPWCLLHYDTGAIIPLKLQKGAWFHELCNSQFLVVYQGKFMGVRTPFIADVFEDTLKQEWRQIQVHHGHVMASNSDEWSMFNIISGNMTNSFVTDSVDTVTTSGTLWYVDTKGHCWFNRDPMITGSEAILMSFGGGTIGAAGMAIDTTWPTPWDMVQAEQEAWLSCWTDHRRKKDTPLSWLPQEIAEIVAKWVATPPFSIVVPSSLLS